MKLAFALFLAPAVAFNGGNVQNSFQQIHASQITFRAARIGTSRRSVISAVVPGGKSKALIVQNKVLKPIVRFDLYISKHLHYLKFLAIIDCYALDSSIPVSIHFQ